MRDLDFIGRSRHCLALIKCSFFDQALIKIETIL